MKKNFENFAELHAFSENLIKDLESFLMSDGLMVNSALYGLVISALCVVRVVDNHLDEYDFSV